MPSNLSGSSLKNTTLSWRTCASRHAGFVCFTAKTAIPSKTVCVKMTWSPHENNGRWCGSSLPRRSMLNSCWRLLSLLVIQCLAMLSNNEVTEGLLIAVLGANFVLLFSIAWHVATARLYFKQVHRLAIAIVRKMDCYGLIDEMLSCSGGTAEKQLYVGTAGDSLASPDTSSGGGHEVAGQSRQQPWKARLGCSGGSSRAVWITCSRKSSHIEELDDSEIERLYARYEARLGAAMTKTLGSAALQLYAGVVSMFLPIPAENQPGLIADLEGDPFFRARSKQCHLQAIPSLWHVLSTVDDSVDHN